MKADTADHPRLYSTLFPTASEMAIDRRYLDIAALILTLFVFFVGLELLGTSFKLLGKGVAATLIETTSNPFVGLFIGILTTSIVQSSSTVTSLTVSIVAGGGLTVAGAIPIVMGANIGTSITNTFVSLGHITRNDEFKRAMAGATVHDFFNLLTVAIVFPLEMTTGLLTKASAVLTSGLSGAGGTQLLSPVHVVVKPVTAWIVSVAQSNGVIVLVVGLVLLFAALRYLVVLLRRLTSGKSEEFIHKYLFGSAPLALLFGTIVTVMVQSSSITTSVIVPMVGAGIVTVAQVFPFVLGANIGTTITALLAALVLAASGEPAGIAALQVAFAHLCFNVFGVALFLPIRPIREIPIRLAEALGRLVSRSRLYALAYVGIVFFVIPLTIIAVTRLLDEDRSPDLPGQDPVEQVDSAPADSAVSE